MIIEAAARSIFARTESVPRERSSLPRRLEAYARKSSRRVDRRRIETRPFEKRGESACLIVGATPVRTEGIDDRDDSFPKCGSILPAPVGITLYIPR